MRWPTRPGSTPSCRQRGTRWPPGTRMSACRLASSRAGPSRRVAAAVGVGLAALLVLSGCATGSLASSETSSSATVVAVPPTSRIAGPTVIVTVPDLVPDRRRLRRPRHRPPPVASAAATAAPQPVATDRRRPPPTAGAEPAEPQAPKRPAARRRSRRPPRPAAPAAPPGEGLNVSLANCDGCTVLATHRGVTGELSAALVGTGSGRAILLSVGGDGQVSGVIGVPYGAAFSAPDGGVLACAQGRCVVQGRQSDGRAILSAFELTDTGAWRDVSGDDAFPSATERAAVDRPRRRTRHRGAGPGRRRRGVDALHLGRRSVRRGRLRRRRRGADLRRRRVTRPCACPELVARIVPA